MKKKVKWLLKLSFTLALFILIFYPRFFGIQKQFIPVTLEGLWQEITGINLSIFLSWILVAMLIKALGMLSSMFRWNLLLKGQAIKLPFKHLIGTFLVGRFFGMFLPSTIGLDGYRLFDVAKHTGKVVESTTVIFIEKLIGFIALTFLVFLTLPLGLRFLPIKPLILAVILLILAAFITFSFILLFNPRIIQILIAIFPVPGRKKIQGKLDKIARAVSAYSGQRVLLAKALALGFSVHLCTTLMYFATAMAIKTTNIDILDILFTSPLMIYGTVLGPSIGGEGIREIIFALILGAKAGAAKAVLFAHLGFWVGEILSVAGGIIYLIRSAEYKPKIEEIQEVLQASKQETSKQWVTEEELQTVKSNMLNAIKAGIFTGLWAGFIVGLIEAFVIITNFSNLPELTVLFWGPLTYSILGGLLGTGFSFVSSCYALFNHKKYNSEKLWSTGFASVFIVFLFVIARFRLVRDILHERQLTVMENMAILVLFALLFTAIHWTVKKLLKNNAFKFLFRGYGAPVIWILFFIFSFGFNKINIYFEGRAEDTYKEPPFKPSPNVVLIMADALRAGHLTAYGYKDNKTPNIDSLRADGILFTNNFGQSSWTKPQSATLLTSLYPSTHNTYLKPHVLPDEIKTLAEVMKSMGFRTGAVVSNINMSPIFNFQQGFDYYCYLAPDYFFYAKESSSKLCLYSLLRLIRERFLSKKKYVNSYYQDATVVNEKALKWLEKVNGSPFFLFLHYMDPHDPYFAHPYNGECVARVSDPNPPADKAGEIRKLYDGEITYMDKHLGKLIKFLKDKGLYDNSLIIFTADHGEEFFDHGGWWHGTTLFDEQIKIPLIIKLPDNKNRGTVDNSIVRSLDVAPTIIDAAGGTKPEAMQGICILMEEGQKEQFVFSEENHEHNIIKSIRTEKWKLILTEDTSPRINAPVMLFDIQKDPAEKNNLASEFPEVVKSLTEKIAETMRTIKEDSYQAKEKEMDDSTRDRLKALGYVE